MSQAPTPLPVTEAYRLWATRYETETAITSLDQQAAGELTPPLANLRLLDAACGTGWRISRLEGSGPALAVGVDLVREMLALGRRHGPEAARLVLADLRHLPFTSGTFDVVWCRLALSYLPDLGEAYRELRRVADANAQLIVTDFHPQAQRAGHRRTFRDAGGVLREVASQLHTLDAHTDAARAAGFETHDLREYQVGPEVRAFYEAAGQVDRYQRDLGLPLVFGLVFGC